MTIWILEVPTIHESMIIGFDGFLSTGRDCLIEEGVDRFARVELQSIQHFRCRMCIRNGLFREKIRTESVSEEHDREGIIPEHC
jgi:hypothetical protein